MQRSPASPPTTPRHLTPSTSMSATTADAPEVRKRAYEDVNVLAATIRRARAGFIKVREGLVDFDNTNHKDTNDKLIQLGTEWQLYIEVFTLILFIYF